MIGRLRGVLGMAAVVSAQACTHPPPPDVLSEIEQVRASAAVASAKELAPNGFAHADKLRAEAKAAFDAGDPAGAQILGERAVAAYTHASILARIARAELSLGQTENVEAGAKKELSLIDEEQLRVTAEAEALELRVKVVKDAQPAVASEKADHDREKARWSAARALALQGRLLCGAAQLLLAQMPEQKAPARPVPPPPAKAPDSDKSEDALAAANAALTPPTKESLSNQVLDHMNTLSKLESDLAAGPPAPIDQASRVRAGCLSALTGIRRIKTPVTAAPGAGDALLSELSAVGTWSPSRDDRGVFVTLRSVFKGEGLVPATAARLAELGRVAAAHPAFPVLVVLHQDKAADKKEEALWKTRASQVVQAISAASAQTKIESVQAGTAMPAVDPEGADRARNARVEIVFVVPETF